jgi:hypothetical protein
MPFLQFNAAALPQPTNEYVVWLDVMGIQSSMARSLKQTANFIFKLHSAALQAPTPGTQIYPVMDGLYVSSHSQACIQDFLRSVLAPIAAEFISEQTPNHRFIVRGAMAYGPVIHGTAVPQAASPAFQTQVGGAYKDAILLGLPMVQANQSEHLAPPFGVFVHESARAFAPPDNEPFHHVWWKWVNQANGATWDALLNKLLEHYAWCKQRPDLLLYNAERIAIHENLAKQYFAP